MPETRVLTPFARLMDRLLLIFSICFLGLFACEDPTSFRYLNPRGEGALAPEGTEGDSSEPNSNQANCNPGYQDLDGDGDCRPTCKTANLNCDDRQVCDDASGQARCVCGDGYEGSDCQRCADGYQDNDGDGNCDPTCALGDALCNDNGRCDDSTGQVRCVCNPGYIGDDCNRCDTGYQDNDQNGSCKADCGTSGLQCPNGHCDDSSGQPSCVCDTGYAGASCNQCDGGYQDNDNNGSCEADCGTAGYTCSNKGRCVDSSGVPRCDCDAGYQDDGNGNCQENAGFIVTSVNDDLNNTDGQIFLNRLQNLGYKSEMWDKNVSTAKLKSYLETDLYLLYHTGHGTTGAVATASGILTSTSTTLNTQHTIFATCLTLADTKWKNAFGPRAQTIMGYTKESLDIVDERVVNTYMDKLAQNLSHAAAWYLANADINSLSDRWASYVREGNSIVEYSARTQNLPSAPWFPQEFVPLDPAGRLKVAASLLRDKWRPTQTFGNLFHVGSFEQETFSDFDSFELLGTTEMSEEEALEEANRWLSERGELPEDAVMSDIHPIEMRSGPDDHPRTVGYEVRFSRMVNGMPIKGNLVADHITLVVGPESVVFMSRFWPEIAEAKQSIGWMEQPTLLTLDEAIQTASEGISQRIKGDGLEIVSAEPVYGTLGIDSEDGTLVPAYALHCTDGFTIIVSALTGEMLI